MAVSHWAEVIESNVNVANNTSTVTLRVHLVTSGESYNYNEQLGNTYIYTPGENKFWRRYTLPPNTDTKIDSVVEGVAHNNDGSKTITWSYSLPTGISAGTVTGSGTATLTTIPRKTSITSFTVSKVNETTLKFNWQTADTVDYAWYSTNNGSTWTGIDVTDGTSGNFNVGNLSPGQSYNCKIKVRRKDSQLESDPSSTVVQSTYAVPTQSLVSKTETSITMKWTLDATADYIEYTTNGTASSPTWVAVGSVNATTGNYTISGLTANTPYNIKTRVRRKSSQTKYATSNLAVSTYNYPYVKSVGTNPLEIGNAQTLTVYNPLGRTATVYMKKTNTSGTTLYSGTTSTKGESATVSFTPTANTLYASIPSAQSATCVYYCTYSSQTVGTKSGTYKVKGTETPTFTNFTYKDNNSTIAAITGNDQVLVQGLSSLRVTIPVANAMVAKNSASGNKYTASCDTRNGNVNYSADSDVYVNLGTITTSGSKAISVSAYDSRNLYTTVIKNVTVIPYAKPTISVTATRLNNFENQTTLKVNGIYSLVKVNDVEKNSITSVKYRYREVGTENWTALTDFTFTTSANTDTTKKYTCTDVTLDLDNTKSFEIEIQTLDGAGQTTIATVTVNIGVPSFFIKKAGGFESNGASTITGATSITGTTTINGNTVVSGSHYLRINGSAASQPLRARAIVGNTADGTAIDNLYVQYGANKPTYFGNTGAYNISADGGTYSGNAATATTATTASKLGSSDVGSSNRPIYLDNGTAKQCNTPVSGNYFSGVPFISGDGVMEVGRYIDFHPTNGSTADFTKRINAGTGTTARTLTLPDHSGTLQVRPTNLYNNTSGVTGTVTLSASAANYNWLEIFYGDSKQGFYSSVRIYSPNGKYAALNINSGLDANIFRLDMAIRKISGTSITKYVTDKVIQATAAAGHSVYNVTEMAIYRVDGWL